MKCTFHNFNCRVFVINQSLFDTKNFIFVCKFFDSNTGKFNVKSRYFYTEKKRNRNHLFIFSHLTREKIYFSYVQLYEDSYLNTQSRNKTYLFRVTKSLTECILISSTLYICLLKAFIVATDRTAFYFLDTFLNWINLTSHSRFVLFCFCCIFMSLFIQIKILIYYSHRWNSKGDKVLLINKSGCFSLSNVTLWQ